MDAIAQQIKDDVWEIFSRALLNQRVPGRYAEAKMQEIFDEVSDYISTVKVGYPSTRTQEEEFAEALTHGMFLVLNFDKEYLKAIEWLSPMYNIRDKVNNYFVNISAKLITQYYNNTIVIQVIIHIRNTIIIL